MLESSTIVHFFMDRIQEGIFFRKELSYPPQLAEAWSNHISESKMLCLSTLISQRAPKSSSFGAKVRLRLILFFVSAIEPNPMFFFERNIMPPVFSESFIAIASVNQKCYAISWDCSQLLELAAILFACQWNPLTVVSNLIFLKLVFVVKLFSLSTMKIILQSSFSTNPSRPTDDSCCSSSN